MTKKNALCAFLLSIIFLTGCSTKTTNFLERIYFEDSEKTVSHGGYVSLAVKYSPIDSEIEPEFQWKSSNPSVASISSTTKTTASIKAENIGSVTITVTEKTNPNKLKATCTINVVPTIVTEISLSPTEITLQQKDKYTLNVVCLPYEATDPRILWSTEDSSIAEVDDSGEITAIGIGTCYITATSASNESVSAKCLVTVTPISVTGIELLSGDMDLMIDDEGDLKYQVLPKDAANQRVSFSSSDEAVVSIDSLGHFVAHQLGTAVLSVTTEDGKYTKSCNIAVKDITAFISAGIDTPGSVIMNGYVTGTVQMIINNSSSKSILVTSCIICDAFGYLIYGNSESVVVNSNEKKYYSQSCSNVYRPYGTCVYEYLGESHTITAYY